jgi:glycine/D-amino acid oxidase-like deaminating enzyme
MTTASRTLSIIGAGIVGLMIAYKARIEWPDRIIKLFDAGPDPNSPADASIPSGATWSGLDARHISITETGPWTSGSRLELIERPSVLGGWNCLAGSNISGRERRWLKEFQAIARDPHVHNKNNDIVVLRNKSGINSWAELNLQNADLFCPTSTLGLLPIVCTNKEDLLSEHAAEFGFDPKSVTDPVTALPPQLMPLEPKLADGTLYGSFQVAGTAYSVKTLCRRLIQWLQQRSVDFHWYEKIDYDSTDRLPVPDGDVVWAAGVSTGATRFMSENNILLQGVVGCWIALQNSGFEHPFKVLAAEPVNFINCTPMGPVLLTSGGYGWVGERPYADAVSLAKPIADAMVSEVSRLLTRGTAEDLARCETAFCIRPALPSGVPLVGVITKPGSHHRVVICVGHAAGGFTEAPAVADEALSLLAV